MRDLISVIIPVYNVEQYLDKCIQSIVHQSYEYLEIILVDDGSTDGSGSICEKWKKIDSRIKVIHKKNGGLADARNTGIDKSIGNYIGFIDSDDYVDETMYEKLYNSIKKEDADVAICNYQFVDKNGDILRSEKVIKTECLSCLEALKKLTEPSEFYYITAWNKLYRKDIFNEIRFPKGKIHEDEFTIHHIFDLSDKIVTINDYLYKYVQRPNSIMNTKWSIKRLDGMEARYDRYLFFKERGLNEFARKALIQSYSILYTCMNNVDFTKNKIIIKSSMKKLIKGLKFDPRTFKLIICYLKHCLTL